MPPVWSSDVFRSDTVVLWLGLGGFMLPRWQGDSFVLLSVHIPVRERPLSSLLLLADSSYDFTEVSGMSI